MKEHFPDKECGSSYFSELNPNPVVELDASGKVTYANPAAKTLFPDLAELGFGHPFLEGLRELCKQFEKGAKKNAIREVKVKEAYYAQAVYYVSKTGRTHIYALDITKQKQTEQSLKRALEEWETTFDSVADLVCLQDAEYKYIKVNKAFAKLFGKKPEEFVGKKCYEVVHGLTQPWPNCPNEKALKLKKAVTEEIFEPNLGLHLSVAVSPIFDGDGRLTGTVHIVRNITASKEAVETQKKIHLQQGNISLMQRSLLRPIPLADKFRIITDSAVRLFDADFCRIWMIQPGDLCEQGCIHAEVCEGPHVCRYRDKCLHLMASSGRYTHIDGKTHRRVPFGCYKIGRVASDKDRKFLTNDVQNDSRVHNREWARELGLVSFAGYQLRVPEGEVLGVLALFAKHPISADEDVMLEGLANTTALVIQQAKSEEALRASEEKYRILYMASHDAIMTIAPPDWKFTAGNPATIELFKAKDEKDFCARGPWKVSPEYQPDGELSSVKAKKMIEIAVQKGSHFFEWMHRRLNGEDFPATVLLTRVELGKKMFLQATVRDITAGKRLENALRESEIKYHSLVEQIPAITYTAQLDESSTTSYVSPQIKNYLGYTPEEYVSGPNVWDKLIHPDDRKRVLKELAASRSADKPFSSEYRMVARDGRIIWFRDEAITVKDKSGRPVCLQGVMFDITDRKEAENLLRVQRDIGIALGSASDLDAATKATLEGLTEIEDIDCGAVYLTDKLNGGFNIIAHKGLSPQFVKQFSRYAPDSSRARLVSKGEPFYGLRSAIPTGEPEPPEGIRFLALVPLRYRNEVVGVLALGSHSRDDISVKVRGVIETISGRIGTAIVRFTAEEALLKSEQKFRAIFEQTFQFIGLISLAGVLIDANRSALRFAGIRESDVIGKPFWETPWWTHSAAEQAKLRDAVKKVAQGEFVRFEATHKAADESMHFVDFSLKPVKNEAGDVVYMIAEGRDITDKKQAEQEFLEIEREERALLDNIPDLAWLKDREGRYIAVNEPFAVLCGLGLDEVAGRTDIDVWSRDLAEKYMADDAEIMKTGKRKTIEEFVENKRKGTRIWAETVKTPVRGEGGEVIGTVGIARDITERRKTSEEIKRLKQQIEFILGATKTGLDIIDSEFNMVYIDPAWAKVYGDPKGKKCYEYFMGKGEPCERCGVARAFQTKSPVITEEILAQENNRPIQVTTIPFQDEDGKWMVAEVNADITERKRIEDALRSSNVLFETLARVSPAGIFRTDMRGILIYVNDRWCKITGCAQKDALGEGWKQAIHPDGREEVIAKWYQCVRERKSFDLEFRFQKPDGSIVWVLGQALPELNEKGEAVGYVGAITDITEHKKEEEELEKKLRELERFYKVTADREKRIIELKEEVKRLKKEREEGANPETEG